MQINSYEMVSNRQVRQMTLSLLTEMVVPKAFDTFNRL